MNARALHLLLAIGLLGCSPGSDADPAPGPGGKADGAERGAASGCVTSEQAEYDYLVVRMHDELELVVLPDGQLDFAADMSEAGRARFTESLRAGIGLIESHGRSYPEDVAPLVAPELLQVTRSREGAAPTADRLPDLASFLAVRTDDMDRGQIEELCRELTVNPAVATAYPQPRPVEALAAEGVDLHVDERWADPALDYRGDANGNGVRTLQVAEIPGARGAMIRIADIETGVTPDHEDLPEVTLLSEVTDSSDHGTAVLGVIGAQDNGFGVTGIVPEAELGFTSWRPRNGEPWLTSTANGIVNAAQWVGPGGIVLIEMHARAPIQNDECDSSCNPGQCNFVAMEYWPGVWSAIKWATANGVHVVEAAGNGEADLDRLLPDRRVVDSGALVVGASLSSERAPSCFSNYGDVVDVHAWGENVLTLGYGRHPAHQIFPATSARDEYTASFSGTSSASPIVVGAMASILGMAAAQNETIDPLDMRDLLRRTGTHQRVFFPPNGQGRPRMIGSLPNVEAAWDEFSLFVPIANFDAEQTEPLTVSLTDLTERRSMDAGAQISRWHWDFGDGETRLGSSSELHRYAAPGEYVVSLTVITANGYSRRVARTVRVVGAPGAEDALDPDRAVVGFVNSASLEVLSGEVGLLPDVAESIVELRPFATVRELLAVPKVRARVLNQLYDFVGG